MPHLTSSFRILILIALFILAGPAGGWTVLVAAEQATPGTVAGQVTDETGGVLPGATVTISPAAGGRDRVVVADQVGRFVAEGLRPGVYRVTTTLSGFEAQPREGVDVGEGATVRVDVVLKVSRLTDSVIVRGTARNFASSVAGKRAADGVVDMVNADEIGRLPDKNIGETLNRIPGVSMLLEKGEGRFVQIRGISPRLNNVTINGMAIGNGETESGGRLAPLDVVGGELLAGVQVQKTPTPDMDAQGIGGTLNLTTKQPFDFARNFTALVSSRGGIESIAPAAPSKTKEAPYALDATLAGKLAGGKVGWLGGVSFTNRMTPLLGVFYDDWRPVAFGGTSITYPTNVKNNVTVTARERLNVNGSLEFRPDAASSYFVRVFSARWDELQLRNRFEEGLGDRLTAIDGSRGGTIAGNRVAVNLRSEPTLKTLSSVAVGGSRSTGRWAVDYVVQRNDNRVDEPNDNWEFRSGASTFGPDTFRIGDDGEISVTSTGPDRSSASLQTFRRVRYFEQLTTEDGTAAALNLRRDTVLHGRWPGFIKAGVKFARTSRRTGVSQANYGIGSLNWTAATAASLTRGSFTNPVPILAVPNLWLDIDGLNAFFQANRNDPRYFVLDARDTYNSEYQSDFSLREDVTAGYLMGRADFGSWNLLGGVRVEATDVNSSAFTMVTRGTTLEATPVDGAGSYVSVLPSVIGTFTLPGNVVARAALTGAVGRPEFDALAPRSRLGIEDNPTIGTIGSLSIGNPDLKARRSRNLDASLEWYFDEGSVLSAAVFRKDISNEIVPAPTERLTNYTYLDQTFSRFDISTTINAEKADVTGVEFAFADQFDQLPGALNGLGVGASLTLIKSGVLVARGDEILRLPLLQQAGRSTSFTMYYQKGKWDLAGTYKYNSNFLTDYGSSRALDLDQGAFGRWDMRAQYELAPNVNLILSGINLNDEPTTEFQGGIKTQITEFEYTGRTFLFGISARLGR